MFMLTQLALTAATSIAGSQTSNFHVCILSKKQEDFGECYIEKKRIIKCASV